MGKALGQCACLCVRVPAFYHVQISSSAAVSSCGAKRPSGDSSSTCRWAPQGTDWALQAGILSIRPLQAAWETGDEATDSLCLLVYCWASVLGGTAGSTWSLCQPILHLCLILTCSKSSCLTSWICLSLSFHFVYFLLLQPPIYRPSSGPALFSHTIPNLHTIIPLFFLLIPPPSTVPRCAHARAVLPTPVITRALLFLRALLHGGTLFFLPSLVSESLLCILNLHLHFVPQLFDIPFV